jgi:glycosyltransferase involved in cell wall biosynthesis
MGGKPPGTGSTSRGPSTRPTRILVIGNHLSSSGRTRQQCEELSGRLEGAGWAVFRTSNKVNRVLRLADMLVATWCLRRKYEVAHVDVFSGPSFVWAELTAYLLKALGKPFVLTLHGGNLPQFFHSNPGRTRGLLQSADVVTAPSRYLSEKMKDCREDIVVVPNGIDIGHYEFRLRSRPSPKLLWLRAFHAGYNPEMALRVVEKVSRRLPNTSLLMVGPDRDGSLARMQRMADAMGLERRIRFLGGVDKKRVPSVMDGCDVFINTSKADNTPVSVIEAMACGLCVVSTNVGGIPYLVENGVEALLVPSNDDEAMSSAVLDLLSDETLASTLSENGRRAAERFDWRRVLPMWETIFSD